MKSTPQDVARWMLEELKQVQYLYQEIVVYEIEAKFGEDFTYLNDNGNMAIDKGVLREFRKLTDSTVVWERGSRLWRMREDYDTPGKRQAE